MLSLRKCVRISEFSGPYFAAFRLNTEVYRINLRIHSEYREIWTRKTPNTDAFHALCECRIYYKMILILEGLPTSQGWLHVEALPCNQLLQEDILLLYQTDSNEML